MLTPEKLAAARALVDACPAGPWHWLCDPKGRRIRIEAAEGTFGKWFETVVDFARYGMTGAAPRFRRFDPAADEPGDLVRADFISVPIPGREHHADWARTIVHPVGRLMVEARTLIPELLDEIARLKQDARETLFRRRMAIDHLAEEIGQRGAENVEEIAARAAAEIARLRAELERLRPKRWGVRLADGTWLTQGGAPLTFATKHWAESEAMDCDGAEVAEYVEEETDG